MYNIIKYIKCELVIKITLTVNIMNYGENNKKYMQNKKIILNKLFPPPPDRRFDKLKIDLESVSYISIPQDSEIITSIIDSQIPKHISRQYITILDGTAGVGGDTLSFGKNFGNVVATEINKNRTNMLINNLIVYELYNVTALNADCINIIKKINFIDIIYFDPPWGGKKYKKCEKMRLKISDYYIDDLVNLIFNDMISISRSKIKIMVFKLPKNYDIKELYQNTKNNNILMYMYELKKMNIILFKSNSFTF